MVRLDCKHLLRVGQRILEVDLECPAGGWCRGERIAYKDDCGKYCLHYEKKKETKNG